MPISLSHSVPILIVLLFTLIATSSSFAFLNFLWHLTLWFDIFSTQPRPMDIPFSFALVYILRSFTPFWHVYLANIQSSMIAPISLLHPSIPNIVKKNHTVMAVDCTTYVCSLTSAEYSILLGNISCFAPWLPGSFLTMVIVILYPLPEPPNPSFIPLILSRSLCLELSRTLSNMMWVHSDSVFSIIIYLYLNPNSPPLLDPTTPTSFRILSFLFCYKWER